MDRSKRHSHHKTSSGDNDIEDVPPIGAERAEAESEPSDDDIGSIDECYDQELGFSDLLDGIVQLRQSLAPSVSVWNRLCQWETHISALIWMTKSIVIVRDHHPCL